jgi:hypothetical protein
MVDMAAVAGGAGFGSGGDNLISTIKSAISCSGTFETTNHSNPKVLFYENFIPSDHPYFHNHNSSAFGLY